MAEKSKWRVTDLREELMVAHPDAAPVLLHVAANGEIGLSRIALHTPEPKLAIYGFCPHCGEPGINRERRPNGNDGCSNGHVYPSKSALANPLSPDHKP